MDELDRELKRVQLQREQLALESELARKHMKERRELARERMKERVFDGAVGTAAVAVGSVLGLLEGIGRFIERWWLLAFVVAVLAAAALGGMEWKRLVEEDRIKEASERRYAAEVAFVKKQCGLGCVGDGSIRDKFVCADQDLEIFYPCRRVASKRFEVEWSTQVEEQEKRKSR
jgi:hypothetical protein